MVQNSGAALLRCTGFPIAMTWGNVSFCRGEEAYRPVFSSIRNVVPIPTSELFTLILPL